ncbi:MAG: UDP-N-acetylmuramate--L-alanine ligase [Chitinophagaceae bacterium]
MTLNTVNTVFFIGIGGIGMSGLARFFKERGVQVSGYDKTETPLTQALVQEGIPVHYTDDVALLNQAADWVIYTPAIPANHTQLNWYQAKGYTLLKRSEVLGKISESLQTLCVAGTHGKTTVSTLLAHILRHTQVGCNAFLGGISANYGVNYWSSPNPLAVIEADEYDRSFLRLFPNKAIVTAMDPDHLDIYGTAEDMESSYLQFIAQVQDTLVYKHGLKRRSDFKTPNTFSYSIQNDAADYYAANIRMHYGTYSFDVFFRNELLSPVQLNMGGMHNVENTIAAMALCHCQGLDMSAVAEAVAAFKGVKRRFEYIVKNDTQIYIDDYAHHPEELRMLLSSAKALFPNTRLSVVFQPHLFSRTRDFADGFAESLSLADEVILLPIYPARELPMEGVSSEMIMQKMSIPNKQVLSKEGVLQWVSAAQPRLLITAGAGDIDTLVNPIQTLLSNQA